MTAEEKKSRFFVRYLAYELQNMSANTEMNSKCVQAFQSALTGSAFPNNISTSTLLNLQV